MSRHYFAIIAAPFILLLVGLFALGGETNLDFTLTDDTVEVVSSTGDDIELPSATDAEAGVLSAADKARLDSLVRSSGGYLLGPEQNLFGDTATSTRATAVTERDDYEQSEAGWVDKYDANPNLLVLLRYEVSGETVEVFFRRDSTDWEEVTPVITGPTGPQGDQGDIGIQGPLGHVGAQGPQGPTGPQGPAGATGAGGGMGTQGDQGPTGPQGSTGPAGPKGDQGDDGPAGAQGSTGLKVPRGPRETRVPPGLKARPAPKVLPGLKMLRVRPALKVPRVPKARPARPALRVQPGLPVLRGQRVQPDRRETRATTGLPVLRVPPGLDRPLDGGLYCYLWLDALTQKVREAGRIVNVSVVVATAVNAEGRREIVGLDVGASEDGAFQMAFLRSVADRGLSGVELGHRT